MSNRIARKLTMTVTLDDQPRISANLKSRGGRDEDYTFGFSITSGNGKRMEDEITILCSSCIWVEGPKTEDQFDPCILKAAARQLAGDTIVELIRSGKMPEPRVLTEDLYNRILILQRMQGPKYGKTFDVEASANSPLLVSERYR